MDGSTLALFIIPIVTMTGLATWLVMVFYVGSHPRWKAQRAAAATKIASTSSAADLPWLAPLPEAAPAEPGRRKVVLPLLVPGSEHGHENAVAARPLAAAAARHGAEHPAA